MDELRAPDIRAARNVLVVRLDEIGDVILCTPFFRALRRSLPSATICVVASPATASLLERLPDVDEVIPFSAVRWGRFRRLDRLRGLSRSCRFAREALRHRRFDFALVPRWDTDFYGAVPMAFASGARVRVGYSSRVNQEKRRMNRGDDHLLTHPVCIGGVKHEVQRNLDLLRWLDLPVRNDHTAVVYSSKDRDYAERALRYAEDGTSWLALAPGAGYSDKMWPLDRFVEIARWLASEGGTRVVVLGGPGEQALGQELGIRAGCLNLIGKTSLTEVAAVLDIVDLLVGNDSGLVHLAAAVGTPVVDLMCTPPSAPSAYHISPDRFGPWGVDHRVVRPPDSRAGGGGGVAHDIEGIDVVTVQQAVRELRPLLPH